MCFSGLWACAKQILANMGCLRQANEARAVNGDEFYGNGSTWRFSTNAGSPLDFS